VCYWRAYSYALYSKTCVKPEPIGLSRCLCGPLIEHRGIFDTEDEAKPLSQEFSSGAETYDERYFNEVSVGEALREVLADVPLPEAPQVLDLGSGSGNSIFPILRFLPEASVIATDLSRPLLEVLSRRLRERSLDTRCLCVRLDLMRDPLFYENSFDLITGNSILHHLLKPDAVLRRVCRWLRPGGSAVFVEPFAIGNLCFALLCERLSIDPALPLTAEVRDLLGRVANDIRVRLARSVPYEQLEDKWLFTVPYLEASVAGLAQVRVTPLPAPLGDSVRMILQHGLGTVNAEIPPLVEEWSRAQTPLAEYCYLSGRIVLTKRQLSDTRPVNA
jgi:ubiquinone/menaquinone biosynthesis C-methylase UbiE